MRHYSASLRAELYKYRKRRTPSLDGSVAGLGPVRSFRNARPATPHGYGFSHRAGAGHSWASPQQSPVYDPQGSHYEWPEPDYEEPKPWFEGFHQRSGAVREPMHSDHPDPFLRGPRYLRMTEEMLDMALDEVRVSESPFSQEALSSGERGSDDAVADSLAAPAEADPADTDDGDVGYEAAFGEETTREWEEMQPEATDWPASPEEPELDGPFGIDAGAFSLEDRLSVDERPDAGWHIDGFGNTAEALDAQYEAEHEQLIDMEPDFDGYAAGPGFDMAGGPLQEDLSHDLDSADAFGAGPEAAMGLEALAEEQVPQEQEAHQDLMDPYSQNPYAPPQTPDEEELQQLLNPFMMPGFFGPGPGL